MRRLMVTRTEKLASTRQAVRHSLGWAASVCSGTVIWCEERLTAFSGISFGPVGQIVAAETLFPCGNVED